MKSSLKIFLRRAAALSLLALLPLARADEAPRPLDVRPGRVFQFPRDHGAHPEFRTEWWYFTGHLQTPQGRRFGLQWTVFRIGLFPPAVPAESAPSPWRAKDLYFSHLAVSDLAAKKFFYSDAAARGALNLAGSTPGDFRVWTPEAEGSFAGERMTLSGTAEDFSFSLAGTRPAGVILHGDAGYSPKATEAGRASYYYSVPHLPVTGALSVGGEPFPVTGQLWMDHEFGSNQLAQGQTGWDWFGLDLGAGSSLMVYRLRGTGGDFISGTYVNETGSAFPLKGSDIELAAGRSWKSPASGADYPLAWTVKIPRYDIDLAVTAAFPAQELQTRRSTQVTYWEGSVAIQGHAGDRPVESLGYLEMTGYAGQGPNL